LASAARNPEKVEKIVKTLNLKILQRDIKSRNTRHLLNLIFSQWLPLATCTVQAVIDIIPPPSSAQQFRIPKILYPELSEDIIEPKSKLEHDLFECNSDDTAYVEAYVSKMFAVPKKDFPEHKKRQLTAEEMRERGRIATEAAAAGNAIPPPKDGTSNADITEDGGEENEVLLGFARLYSGRLRVGSHIFALLPKYDTSVPPSHPRNTKFLHTIRVDALYTMMGRELVPVDEVLAGNVFAVAGLEGKVWRSATLCSPGAGGVREDVALDHLNEDEQAALINLGSVNIGVCMESFFVALVLTLAIRMLRLSEWPWNLQNQVSSVFDEVLRFLTGLIAADMQKMVQGLRLLTHSDSCVEAFQQQTGEWVILTAGELHLEVSELSF
jgi:ribosome assembly protein 1